MRATTHPEDRLGRRWRDAPPLVLATTCAYLVVLLAYSILLPTYRGPDEPNHVDLTRLVANERTYPDWDSRSIDPSIVESWRIVRFGDGSQHLAAVEAPPRGERASLDDLGEAVNRTRPNQLPQHPPLFYALVGGGSKFLDVVVPGDVLGSFDQEVWLYRVFGLMMIVPLPLIIWAVGRRLRLPEPVTTAAMLLPLAIPQLTYMGAVVNNDSLLLLLAWLHVPLLSRIAGGDLRLGNLGLAGFLTGLALVTKGLALVLPVAGLVAIALGWRSVRDQTTTGAGRRGQALGACALYGLTSLTFGGWWWVRNLIRYGELAPSIEYERLAAVGGFTPDIGEFLHAWAYQTNRRFWGDFGWRGFEVPLATPTIAVATVVALGALALSFRRIPFGVDRANRVLLLTPWLLFAAFVALNAWRLYARSSQLPLLQGRYWFGGLVGIALTIVLGAGTAMRRHLRLLPVVVLGAVAAMQLVALLTILDFYWGPPGGSHAEQLRAVVAWSPLPGEVVGVGAVLGTVVVATLVFLIIRAAFDNSGASPSEPELSTAQPPDREAMAIVSVDAVRSTAG